MYLGKRIKALVLAAMLITVSAGAGYNVQAAKSISDLKTELADSEAKRKKAKQEKEVKEDELESAVERKNEVDQELAALRDDMDSIDEVIEDKQKEIDEKTEQIEKLSDDIDDSKDLLKERMKVMYENGTVSYLEMIFEAKGMSDLFTRIAVVQDIVTHDKNMIEEYAQQKNEIEENRKTVENEKSEQEEARQLLADKESEVKKKQSERDEIVKSLESEVNELEKMEAESEKYEEQARKELQEAIAKQEAEEKAAAQKAAAAKKQQESSSSESSAPAKTTAGGFGWPSASSTRITSEFSNNRKNPVTGVWRKHTGMDIGAAEGTNVLASKSGTVVTAQWNNGYGYYITINHGDGVATLYAHNSKLLVKAGDKVEKGQVIAKVGSTGNSTGPHIHFEIIINGVPQNPRNYL